MKKSVDKIPIQVYTYIRNKEGNKKGEKKMKYNRDAIENLKDSYEDLIIEAWEINKRHYNFPMMLLKECKAAKEEISWAEENGWITKEEAREVWEHIEKRAEDFMRDWETYED